MTFTELSKMVYEYQRYVDDDDVSIEDMIDFYMSVLEYVESNIKEVYHHDI